MRSDSPADGIYVHEGAGPAACHTYLLPAIIEELRRWVHDDPRVFDLGCGSGYVAQRLTELGYVVKGVDSSISGIEHAREHYPHLDLRIGSAYEDLVSQFGRFHLVVSLEVVEHVFEPRRYASTLHHLLEPGGIALVSTPYHGYWKNLAIAATNSSDRHFAPLWDGGHIKFWSRKTLTQLLEGAGLDVLRFRRVGRIPVLAKSMIAVVRRPFQ